MKIHLLVLIIISSLIVPCCTNPVSSDSNDHPANPIPFQYPPVIYYNTYEWQKLSTIQRYSVLQIPEDILPNLSTSQLIQAYLDYPLTGIIDAYNFVQDGFERVMEDFNGLRFLLKRTDLFTAELEYYKYNIDPKGLNPDWDLYTIGKYMHNINYFEILLGQESTLEKLSYKEIKELFKECYSKYQSKMELKEYHVFGAMHSLFPIGRAMRVMHKKYGLFEKVMSTENIDAFLEGRILTEEVKNIIIQEAVEYINS